MEDACPCGTGRVLARCCGPVLAGGAAPTAEALMRSRYTAFAVGDVAHLARSWHPDTRPSSIRLVPDQRWTGLEVHEAVGGLLDQEGTVRFTARFERAGRPGALHERSRFARHDGRWTYLDGTPT